MNTCSSWFCLQCRSITRSQRSTNLGACLWSTFSNGVNKVCGVLMKILQDYWVVQNHEFSSMPSMETSQNFEKGRIKALQDERVYIQKKTFTKWANAFLEKVRNWDLLACLLSVSLSVCLSVCMSLSLSLSLSLSSIYLWMIGMDFVVIAWIGWGSKIWFKDPEQDGWINW